MSWTECARYTCDLCGASELVEHSPAPDAPIPAGWLTVDGGAPEGIGSHGVWNVCCDCVVPLCGALDELKRKRTAERKS